VAKQFTGARPAQLETLYQEMAPKHLSPLWEHLADLVPRFPKSRALPHRWSYEDVRGYLLQAGNLISAQEAERRVLILENPALRASASVTPSLYAGLQLLLPGEIAPCHRHSQCALRFVLEGEGAYTSVDGEKAVMRPFDLVLTPAGQWHDHGNPTAQPIIWLDGLDIPTVRHFEAGFAEVFPQPTHPETAPPGDTLARYGRNMRPFRNSAADRRPTRQPLFHYPHAEWRQALDSMPKAVQPDAHLGHALEFLNPADGGSVMPTISAHVRLLPRGFETRPRRSTDGTVFVVVEGTGEAHIGAERLELSPRDIFVAPSWTSLSLKARDSLVLFAFSDKAAQQKLNLYREECL
jgi:gentisate 1,2-dioxygenase